MATGRSGSDGVGSEPGAGTTLKRRGLIAGAAALAAGLLAKQAAQPVAAGIDGDVVLGAPNTTALDTSITETTANGTVLTLTCNAGSDGWGLDARGSGYGVIGRSNTAGTQVGGAGVYGETSRPNSYGVNGLGPTTGVQGMIDPASTAAQQTFGVIGRNSLNRTDAYGVLGTSDHGVGVYGQTGAGLYGVRGDAGPAPGGAGLLGVTTLASGIAFGSVVVAPAVIAGYFNGEVHVEGPFYVDPISNKHGVIAKADGTKHVFYSMESPESWVEDFGEAKLVGGKATVALDKDFAAVIHAGNYHVFLTAYGNTNGLHVTNRSAAGFTVTEHNGGTNALTFSYRVVARPNVGKKVERMPKYTPPPKLDIAGIEKSAHGLKLEPARPVKKP